MLLNTVLQVHTVITRQGFGSDDEVVKFNKHYIGYRGRHSVSTTYFKIEECLDYDKYLKIYRLLYGL